MRRTVTLIAMLISASTSLFAQEDPLYIDANGNVRIGTGRPSSKLDINANINANADLNVNGLTHFTVNLAPNTGNHPMPDAGLYMGWNKSSGRGETNFINNTGKGGPGGFRFDNINGQTSTTLMTISGSGNVGIGTDSPNTSAILELSSTTQGFLPPRLTLEQRNAMQAPVEGLVIWCRNCAASGELQVFNGAKWTNMVGDNASFLKIGEPYQGGILAYILRPGDPGYDPETYHGLIVAVTDQTSGNNTAQLLPSANGNDPGIPAGSGKESTAKLTVLQSEAAKLCTNLNAGNYRDWYLPSHEEWEKLLTNQQMVTKAGLSGTYWSSSIVAVYQRILGLTVAFPRSERNIEPVDQRLKVRAMRSF